MKFASRTPKNNETIQNSLILKSWVSKKATLTNIYIYTHRNCQKECSWLYRIKYKAFTVQKILTSNTFALAICGGNNWKKWLQRTKIKDLKICYTSS